MARHVPLYQAVLEVLRAVALCPVLLPLLLPRSNGYSPNPQERASKEAPSIASLLEKMKQCVDTYSKTLRYGLFISVFKKLYRLALKMYFFQIDLSRIPLQSIQTIVPERG